MTTVPLGAIPTIDVIILTWNDGDLLTKAIDSAIRAADGLDVNILVLDNTSEPPAVVVDHPQVRLVRSPTNRGVAGGRNDGVAQTAAPLVCFLDLDAELHPDSLHALAAPLMVERAVAMAVPVFTTRPLRPALGPPPACARRYDGFVTRTASTTRSIERQGKLGGTSSSGSGLANCSEDQPSKR